MKIKKMALQQKGEWLQSIYRKIFMCNFPNFRVMKQRRGRSLIYSRKSKGHKTVSCGTPHVILELLDIKPLVDTICLWFAKYESNHLFANPHIP